jgi:hypothetical protein
MGDLFRVVQQLKKERKRLADELYRVTSALTAFGNVYLHGSKPQTAVKTRTTRTISAAGRERIAVAQRARWAKHKSDQSEPRKRTMSPAARKKIAAAQRARWAQVKKLKAPTKPARNKSA